MDKLTELQISKINGINTNTQKIGLGNILQALINENKLMHETLDSLTPVKQTPIVEKVTNKEPPAVTPKV